MSHDLYESVVGPLWVRDGCMYQFTGPERTRRGGKVLVVDAERRQRGATAGPRSTSVADPTRRASGPRYGSVFAGPFRKPRYLRGGSGAEYFCYVGLDPTECSRVFSR